MSRVRSTLRSGGGRVAMAAVLLLGLFTVAPMMAGSASAHMAHLDASVSCDGTVEWSASSWSKDDNGSNGDVRIHRSADGGAEDEVGHGSFSAENGYSFSGRMTWPAGATTMTVSTHPQGMWGSGDDASDRDGMGKDCSLGKAKAVSSLMTRTAWVQFPRCPDADYLLCCDGAGKDCSLAGSSRPGGRSARSTHPRR